MGTSIYSNCARQAVSRFLFPADQTPSEIGFHLDSLLFSFQDRFFKSLASPILSCILFDSISFSLIAITVRTESVAAARRTPIDIEEGSVGSFFDQGTQPVNPPPKKGGLGRLFCLNWLRVVGIGAVYVYHRTRFFGLQDWHVQDLSQLALVFQAFVV